MLIYAGLLLLDLGFLYLIAASGASGAAYITLTIVSLVGLLLAYHVWQHIRDLGSPLAETEGAILRKWSRAEFIIAWQNYYIYVEHAVFKLGPVDYALLEKDMHVKIVHFPRTLNVVSAHAVRGAPAPDVPSP